MTRHACLRADHIGPRGPGAARPSVVDTAGGVACRPLGGTPAGHLAARGALRQARGTVYAVKETGERVAEREYDLLRALERIDFPAVEAVAIVADRQSRDGEPLDPVLITRHLQFSLPYRALFSHTLRPETMTRLLDALAALIVRMHLTGFFWGDCSLSNTLFRRDAGAFAAYLVDAETGALHPKLSNGQRGEDLEIARVNIFGEALDLQAAGLLHDSIDPEVVSEEVVQRYERLWHEVTYEQEIQREDRHDIEGRIRRLNELGFDVAEVAMSLVDRGAYRVRPKVVDAGYHTRRLMRLAGLDAEENQARRLLNDLDTYRAESDLTDEQQAAHRWLTEVFEPVVRAVPAHLRRKLEPSELFVQIIEHRWRLSEEAGRDVGLAPAVQSFLNDVLVHRPDEQAVLGVELSSL
ncbi:LPS kinase [Phytohabitans rumicis]|uniref:LPS kinase n=1 Tax=Phytohabitans rumicis TaxID=1076125 RepID=A0A6V8L0Y6_9ACTN|nr:LPS kinase [Phytohabitans rumicis]